MDQKTKDQITAELTAEYRATVQRTAEQEERARQSGYGTKSIRVAYLLWFLLGQLGAHRLYLGRTASGAGMAALTLAGSLLTVSLLSLSAQMLIGLVLFVPVWIWWLVDAFLIPGMMPDRTAR